MTIPYVYHNLEHFVNRETEIGHFEQLIAQNRRRILLIHGAEGVGKSGLLYYLIDSIKQQRSDGSMTQAFVDFRRKPETCILPKALIYQLGKQLGDLFLELLNEIDSEAPVVQVRLDAGALKEGLAQANKDVSQAIVQGMASAHIVAENVANFVATGGGANIDGDINTGGGDVIGRDRIDIDIANTVVLSPTAPLPDPGAGQQQSALKRAWRQNRYFRDALEQLLEATQVMLYFDHCEETEDAVCNWLIQELLDAYLDPLLDTSGLRIVFVGRSVPWQEHEDSLKAIVSERELGALELEHVEQYCVEKRGLKSEEVPEVMQACAGVPFLMLQEAEKRLR